MSRHEEDEDERYYVIEEKGGGFGSFLLGAVFGAGIALLLVQIMLAPPRADLAELGAYLAASGTATVLVAWILMRVLDERFGLTLADVLGF